MQDRGCHCGQEPGGLGRTASLDLGAGKKINIYMDSRYAFAIADIHCAIYQERALLTSEGKEKKNKKTKQEILDLLDALMQPATVSIIYCPGHQKGRDSVAQGNNHADQAAQ
jgi:ribonuclease HI